MMNRYGRHGDYHEMGCLELFIAGVLIFLLVAVFASAAVQSIFLQ